MRILIICLLFGSCSLKQFYPTGGAIVGGAVGSLAGPVGSGLGAGSGALLGEVARGNEEIQEAKETITALTTGDVDKMMELKLKEHTGLFESFTSGIKRVLSIALVFLLIYLAIPIFVAKKCSKNEAVRLTRAPFHGSRDSYPRRGPRKNENNKKSDPPVPSAQQGG